MLLKKAGWRAGHYPGSRAGNHLAHPLRSGPVDQGTLASLLQILAAADGGTAACAMAANWGIKTGPFRQTHYSQ
jgi:hypothetical protein